MTQIITKTICLSRHVREEINWNVCLVKVKQFDKRLEAAHVEKTFYFNRELRTLWPWPSRSVCQEWIPSPSRLRVLQLLHYLYDADLSRGHRTGDWDVGSYHQTLCRLQTWVTNVLGCWRGFNLSKLLQFWTFFRTFAVQKPGLRNYKKHIKRGTSGTTAAVNFYLTSWPQGKEQLLFPPRGYKNQNKFIEMCHLRNLKSL